MVGIKNINYLSAVRTSQGLNIITFWRTSKEYYLVLRIACCVLRVGMLDSAF